MKGEIDVFKLASLFVEITAPLDKLKSDLGKAHVAVEKAAAGLARAATVPLKLAGAAGALGLGAALVGSVLG
jgi:hypothetical protein